MASSPENKSCFAAGKKIIVAGGGMAGLSFVIALRKQWQSKYPSLVPPKITIYERDASKEAGLGREGYSLSIRSDGISGGMQTLQKLGLLDVMISRTGGPETGDSGNFCLWDKDWNEVFRARQKLAPGLPQPHIRSPRNVLRQTLLEAVPTDVEIKWGVICTSAKKSSDGRVIVELSNSSLDECDLLVAADGSRSKIRAAIRPNDTLTYQGVVAIIGTARFSEKVPPPADKDWGMNMTGTGTGLFVAPIDKQSVVWSLSYLEPELKQFPRPPMTKEQFDTLIEDVLERGKTIPEPFPTYVNATDPTSLSVLNAMDKEPFSHEAEELRNFPVVFIGDANHAVSPFAGNGANMAMSDGWALAKQLCNHESLKAVLGAYDEESLPRVKSVLKTSHRTITMSHFKVSSRGLGLSIAEAALSSGASVIATARNPSSLAPLVQKFKQKVFPLTLDASSNESVLAAISAGHKNFGRIDVLVNNAGYADTAPIEDMPLSNFLDQINTNFLGVVYATKAVLPIMRSQGEGHIIQISSLGGRMGNPGISAYQSAKWAVGGFSTVLAQEVKHLGIKITVLEPGGMLTDWAGSSMTKLPISEPYKESVGKFLQYLEQMKGYSPSKPDKVAGIVLKLSEMRIDECPLRLLVGTDAVHLAEQEAKKLRESDEKWRELSISSV